MKFFLLLIFSLLSSFVVAQQNNFNWRIGVFTGNMTYRGDLNEKWLDSKKMLATDFDKFAYGVSFEHTPNKTLSQRLQFSSGEFIANDRQTGIFERSLNVKTKLYEAAYLLTFYTDNGWLLGENALISPYFQVGVGGIYFENYGDLFYQDEQRYYYWQDGSIHDAIEGTSNAQLIEQDGIFETRLDKLATEKNYSNYTLTIPVGLGLKFRLLNRLSLHVQSTISYAPFSDYLDDVSGDFKSDYDNQLQSYAANPANYKNGQGTRGNTNQGFFENDAFIFTSISLQWSFSPKRNAFRAPRLYASSRPKSIYEINPDSLQRKTMETSTFGRTNTTTTDIATKTNQVGQVENSNPAQDQSLNPHTINPTQRIAIDINVNVNTSQHGTDSSITKVVVSPNTGTMSYPTQNGSPTYSVDTAAQNKKIADLESRLNQLQNTKYFQKTSKQSKGISQTEVEQLQAQINALKNIETPTDSTMYRLMDMQFTYLQERLKLLDDKLENEIEMQQLGQQQTQVQNSSKEIDDLTKKIEELALQIQALQAYQQSNTATIRAKDTVIIKEQQPITSEVVGVRKVEIFFKTASAEIHPKDKVKLIPMIEVLKQNPTWSVRIYGFTDSKGSSDFNQKLSQRRTDAVKILFLEAGISEPQLIEGSFGIDVNNPYGDDFYGRRVEVELNIN